MSAYVLLLFVDGDGILVYLHILTKRFEGAYQLLGAMLQPKLVGKACK